MSTTRKMTLWRQKSQSFQRQGLDQRGSCWSKNLQTKHSHKNNRPEFRQSSKNQWLDRVNNFFRSYRRSNRITWLRMWGSNKTSFGMELTSSSDRARHPIERPHKHDGSTPYRIPGTMRRRRTRSRWSLVQRVSTYCTWNNRYDESGPWNIDQ